MVLLAIPLTVLLIVELVLFELLLVCADKLFEQKAMQLFVYMENKEKEIAQKDYKHWFGKGASFFIDTFHALERKDFNKGAFELHQATESFYSTILLVFTGYKPKLHDILQLSQMARSYNHELFKIYPCETDE
jgi:hypothetical protein